MSQDDPFAEQDDSGDKTVIRPRPGGSRSATVTPTPPPRAAEPGQRVDMTQTGINALVAAASSLLGLAIRVKNKATHSDVDGLRQRVMGELRQFENAAVKSGAAHYAVCATVDDLILNTPWGSRSVWTSLGMVSTFHKGVSGGERFFDMLKHLEKDPEKNLEVLELMYLCLTLGFEGRLRLDPRGATLHGQIRDSLFQTIRRRRGEFERDISIHWRGIDSGHRPLTSYVPIWVVAVIAVALMMATFMGLSYALSVPSDEVSTGLRALPPTENPIIIFPQPVATYVPPVAAQSNPEQLPRIKAFLEVEEAEGLVTVFQDFQTVTVRITGQGMFASGSDQIQQRFLPVLDRIAGALNDEFGDVIIEGHSDGDPINTPRFPSNWHLSQLRAESTLAIMARLLADPSRLRAEGMADTEPLVNPEVTRDDKARNRRIEVILLK